MSEIIKVKFLLNNNPRFVKKVRKEQKLSEVRKMLNNLIEENYVFLTDDKFEIPKEDEEDFILSESIVDGKIYLKSSNLNTTNKTEPNIPIERSKYLYEKNNLKIYLYDSDRLSPEEEKNAIVFMVVGQTGSGKTTLLNAFINYILGIQYENDFRYNIIYENFNKRQDISQTSEVSIYNIKAPDGTIFQIIDTPGLGGTGGFKEDFKIIQQIRQTLIDKLSSITCICFVAQSSNRRLTAYQKYIFDCILDLFGNDLKSNFVFMLTFADGSKPLTVDAFQSKESLFYEIICSLGEHWFYKFNNSGIFEKYMNNQFNKVFFKLVMKNFEEFIIKIKKLNKISLNKTKELILERQNLENYAELLQVNLKEGIDKISCIKNLIEMIKKIKQDLNDCKNFTLKIKNLKKKQIPLPEGKKAINCLYCMDTCLEICNYKDDEIWKCSTMTGDRNNAVCTICIKKCHWTHHKGLPYIFKKEEVEETFILEELKKRYYDSKNYLDVKNQLIIDAKKDLIQIKNECMKYKNLIIRSINRLKEIALNQNYSAISEEYIDLLIQDEEDRKKTDYKTRIEGLHLLKGQKRILREIYENKNAQLLDIEKFINDTLENEKNGN